MMAPIYAKLRADPCHPVLSDRDTAALGWWAAALPKMEPLVATQKGDLAERIVYTDAAGKSQIFAAVILGASAFRNTKYIRPIAHIRTGERWKSAFDSTSYIYGIEMLAVLTTLVEKGAGLENRLVTFYINNNAMLEILQNSATPASIQAMKGLIWHRIRELNITSRFGRVPSKRNIAELPTRSVKIKYKSRKRGKFRMAIALQKLIETTIGRISKCLPIEPPSVKNRTLVTLPGRNNRKGVKNI